MTVFWNVEPRSLAENDYVSEVFTASITRATRLLGATSQKTVIYILAAVRT
jgi:hypothetical protein